MSGQLSGNQERAAQIAALNDEFRKSRTDAGLGAYARRVSLI